MTKKATIEHYRHKLGTDPAWAIKGLLRIYKEQTETEKEYEVTSYSNGVGFSGVDAKILTSFAKQYEWNGRLTEKQVDLLFLKMPKYASQLYRFRTKDLEVQKKDEQVGAVA